jgi:hypothetical protein
MLKPCLETATTGCWWAEERGVKEESIWFIFFFYFSSSFLFINLFIYVDVFTLTHGFGQF